MFNEIKAFFHSHQIPVSDDWLTSCLEWCREENIASTVEELKPKVYEQWLLLDLRDLELATLPRYLGDKKLMVLNGNFCLQMMYVLDISKPKHWIMQQIRKDNVLTKEDENSSAKRMLMLHLTDGVQYVNAMEFRPIPFLNINLTPGVKIRIMGPITIRRGRLMLEAKNIKILGGEVEDILISHCVENVLARELKLPENPNPTKIDEAILVHTNNQTQATQNQTNYQRNITLNQTNVNQANVTNRRQNTNVQRMEDNFFGAEDDFMTDNIDQLIEIENKALNRTIPAAPVQKVATRNVLNVFNADDYLMNDEIDELLELERDVFSENKSKEPVQTKVVARKVNNKTPDLFEDDLDMDFDELEAQSSQEHLNKHKTGQENSSLRTKNYEQIEEISSTSHLTPKETPREAPSVPKIPILSPVKRRITPIEKLLQIRPNISNGFFYINAKFDSVVERLTAIKKEYNLLIKVTDPSGEMTVKLDTDIISSITGYFPDESKALVENGSSQSKSKVMEGLEKLKIRLLEINGDLKIKISGKLDIPVIVELL